MPLEEMGELWETHWFWRRFCGGAPRTPKDAELAKVPASKEADAPSKAPALPPPATGGADPSSCYYTI